MKTVSFEDFVRLPNFFYATVGIEPYRKEGAKRWSCVKELIFYSGVINMNLCVFAELLYVMSALYNGRNFVEATMTLSYIGFVFVGDSKMFYVWWKKEQMTSFMRELSDIFPKTLAQQKHYDLRTYLKRCTRITKGFSMLYMILIWTYNLNAVMQYLTNRLLGVREIVQTLPYFMYIPWEWHGHWSYYLLYASSNFAGFTAAAGQISSDLMLSATATQVIMHYDFVANRIEEYQIQYGTSPDKRKDLEQDMKFLSGIIAYHAKILRMSDIMNDVFGIPLLCNFLTSSFIICFVGFQMSIGVSTDALMKLFLFLFSSSAQIYLICHYGQELIDSSQNIARAVYDHNWQGANVRYQKMLVLLMQRAQKPALLKATQFVRVSRATMTEIMQMSYKFFALLRTMYSD